MEKQEKIEQAEQLRIQALQAFNDGEANTALELLQQASAINTDNFKIYLDLVKIYFQTSQAEKAQELINQLSDSVKESNEGKYILYLLECSQILAKTEGIKAIQKSLKDDENDTEALYQLAMFFIVHSQVEQAMQILLKIFISNRDFNNGIAQKSLIKLFNLIQNEQAELVASYRSKLQNYLF